MRSQYFAFQSLKNKLKGNDYRGSLILICSKSHLNITKCVDSAPKSQLRPPWSRDKGKELSNGCSAPLPCSETLGGCQHSVNTFKPQNLKFHPSPAPAASTCNSLVLGLGHRSHHRASNKTKYISHNTDRDTVKLGLYWIFCFKQRKIHRSVGITTSKMASLHWVLVGR